MQWVAPLPADRLLATLRLDVLPRPIRDVDRIFNDLGRPAIAAVTVLVAFLVVLRYASRLAATGLVFAPAAALLSTLIKAVCGSTPLRSCISRGGTVDFPSGHTAFATSFFGYLAIVSHRSEQRGLSLLALLTVLAMGVERTASGDHLFSDVIAGYLLGIAWLILVVLAIGSVCASD